MIDRGARRIRDESPLAQSRAGAVTARVDSCDKTLPQPLARPLDRDSVRSVTPSTGDPAIYTPFPSFSEWQKTPVDTEQFDRYARMFEGVKKSAEPARVATALRQAMRYAAVDTNAIEGIYETDRGFTKTVATQAAAWQAAMDARGQHVRRAFTDALNGYEYVLDATTQSTVITEVWVRELHSILCASQDSFQVFTQHGPEDRPLPKGAYKSLPNSPTLLDGRVHAYAPVADTPAEMHRLVQEIRSARFSSAHPVIQAAYAHYAYVCIHPFADGNGRVARALASAYLYRSPGVPLVVFADQRNDYFDSLEHADSGDPTSFIQFVGARAIDTVGMMRVILEQTSPPIEQTLARLGAIFNVSASDEELQRAALRLKALAYSEMSIRVRALDLPPQLSASVNPNEVRPVRPPASYGSVGKSGSFFASMNSSWPVTIRVVHSFGVFVREEEAAESDLVLVSSAGSSLEVSLREVDPIETEALKVKVSSWADGAVADLLADAEDAARLRR